MMGLRAAFIVTLVLVSSLSSSSGSNDGGGATSPTSAGASAPAADAKTILEVKDKAHFKKLLQEHSSALVWSTAKSESAARQPRRRAPFHAVPLPPRPHAPAVWQLGGAGVCGGTLRRGAELPFPRSGVCFFCCCRFRE